MILTGLDEAWAKVDPVAAAQQGYKFVIGYVSQDNTGKNLTGSDISRIHDAGLAVAFVYEYNADSALGGYAQGVTNANIALDHFDLLMVPPGVACYNASTDFNVQPGQMGVCLEHETGFMSTMHAAGFRSGVYTGFPFGLYLTQHNYGGLIWQTYAWSADQWLAAAAVRQTANGVHAAGSPDVDIDESEVPDFGQWSATSLVPQPIQPPLPIARDDMLTHWANIQQGSTGPSVRIWQGILCGHSYTVSIDGIFGPDTHAKTVAFQGDKRIVVDGVVGPHSLSMGIYNADYAG